ncbi:MAG: hypothetical protein R3C45_13340 [Phycisphaerales bacterium]
MTETTRETDVLFISEQPLWPMDQGYRVHGCQMARALSELGHTVRMASLRPTVYCDQHWLNLMLADWPTAGIVDEHAEFMRGWSGRSPGYAVSSLRIRRHGHTRAGGFGPANQSAWAKL